MSSYNGLVCQLTGVTTNIVAVGCTVSVPSKFFSSGQFAVVLADGVSGTVGIRVIGSIGGATFPIAGATALSTTGSFPLPLINYVGISGSMPPTGFPRPWKIEFARGLTSPYGITASVYLCGNYGP